MTDRELLELAAKAAKIHGSWVDAGINCGSYFAPNVWNPLVSDRDAFKLMVKLSLLVDVGWDEWVDVDWLTHKKGETRQGYVKQEIDGDRLAATRRAIVRAAVEVGRVEP
jgi:NMD protein affecting ribosome stability and mRNA decay